MPLTWRHFRYGIAHLARASARDSLRLAAVGGVGWMKKDDAREWYRTQTDAAGW